MKEYKQYLRGSGSGKGGNQHTPVEADDSLSSIQFGQVIDLLSEGEIEGLDTGDINSGGLQSIFLNGTRIQNPDGTNNFNGFTSAFRKGTQTQNYIPTSELGTERSDINNAEVTAGNNPYTSNENNGFVFTVTNTNVNRVRVTMMIPNLRRVEDDGDIVGYAVKFNIQVNYDGAGYNNSVFSRNANHDENNGYWTEIKGKTSTQYKKDYVFSLSSFSNQAQIRVVRISPDDPTGGTEKFFSKTFVAGATEIIDSKLRYPNSALAFLRFDSRQFSSIPRRKYLIRGIKVQLPNNAKVDISETQRYVVATGATETITDGIGYIGRVTYTGVWDGTFGTATWCADPAWCFYNLLTNTRYGCSVNPNTLQKFEFFAISQYCNELVPDQKGGTGQEPRMLVNILINTRKQIHDAIKDFTSIFRGQSFYGAGIFSLFQDKPETSRYLIGNATVVEGFFEYTGTSQQSRHTTVTVAYQDYQKLGEVDFEYIEDVDSVSKYGIINKQIKSIGTYSQGQAHRLGLWTLKTEQFATETVSFSVPINSGMILMPGMVIDIADKHKTGYRHTGFVSSGSTTTAIKIDNTSDINQSGSNFTISIILSTGLLEKKTVSTIDYSNRTINLAAGQSFSEAPAAQTVYLLENSGVPAQQYRVIDVKDDGVTFKVVALKYNNSLYNAVDLGEPITVRPVTDLTTAPDKPTNFSDNEFLYSDGQGVFVGCDISWQHNKRRVTEFLVTYRVDNDNWATISTAATSVTLRQGGNFGALRAGRLQVQVQAINYLGKSSGIAIHNVNLAGKTAAPGQVQNLTMIPTNGLARLQWTQSTELDVVVGGLVRLRHSPLLSGVTWANSNSIHEDVTGTAKEAYVDLKEGTYSAKFIDSGGRESVDATLVEFDEPDLEDLLDINTQTENNTFAGLPNPNTSNLEVVNGELVLKSNGSVLHTSGTYYFANNPIDLTAVFSVKLKSEIKSRSFFPTAPTMNTLGLDFDPLAAINTTGIAALTSFVGDTPENNNVQLYVRTTQQNPSNNVWSTWRPFNNAEFKARAYEFKAELTTNDNTAQLAVYGLKIISQMTRRTINGSGTTLTNADLTVNFANNFVSTPIIGVTFSAATTGEYYKITSSSSSSFSISIYDSNNSRIAKAFTFTAIGFGKSV